VADYLDDKCRLLEQYASDLRKRFEAQKEWDARHPDFRTWDEAKWDFVNEVDPRPSTADVISVERWLMVIEVATAAYKETHNG
jgi:hypothetical protein